MIVGKKCALWLFLLGLSQVVWAGSPTSVAFSMGLVNDSQADMSWDAMGSDWQLALHSGTWFGLLNPSVGLELAGGNHGYAWGGVSLPVPMGALWSLRPGVDLGYLIDDGDLPVSDRFRTRMGADLDYRVDEAHAWGVGTHVVSQALSGGGLSDMVVNIHYRFVL